MYKCFGILIGDHRTIGQFNLKINLRKILDSTIETKAHFIKI